MLPIIGIYFNEGESPSKKKTFIIYQNIFEAVKKSGGIPIGFYDVETLNIVDGVILQGGDEVDNLDIVKTLHEKNIKTLGICLGMQKMGMYFDGAMESIKEHKSNNKYVHDVVIDEKSLLYKVINKQEIQVNSRHKDCLTKTNLKISAYSKDGIIEAIEDETKKFFLGVQWHPEDMITYDVLEQNIFNYFVNTCKDD